MKLLCWFDGFCTAFVAWCFFYPHDAKKLLELAECLMKEFATK
jgi:hypothetical protein